MAAASQISEYEPEIVRGEVVERPMPDTTHAELQMELGFLFRPAKLSHGLWVGGDLRVRTSAGNLRLIDVAIYRTRPTVRLPENPPVVTVEILSPEDRFDDVFEKCEEYRAWGVENVWAVEPRRHRLCVYRDGELHSQPDLSLPEFGVHVSAASLFAQLPT